MTFLTRIFSLMLCICLSCVFPSDSAITVDDFKALTPGEDTIDDVIAIDAATLDKIDEMGNLIFTTHLTDDGSTVVVFYRIMDGELIITEIQFTDDY